MQYSNKYSQEEAYIDMQKKKCGVMMEPYGWSKDGALALTVINFETQPSVHVGSSHSSCMTGWQTVCWKLVEQSFVPLPSKRFNYIKDNCQRLATSVNQLTPKMR